MNLILLAAGYSRRFPGRKLLARLDGKPLYLITLEKLEALCSRHTDWKIIVVTSYDEIEVYCKERTIACIRNDGMSNTGIASSIEKAVCLAETFHEPAGKRVSDVFFTADQPLLTVDTIEQFLLAYGAQDKKLGALVCDGIWRNPNVFDNSFRRELLSLTGEEGGKHILKQHREEVFCYPVTDAAQFSDIDTAEDYFSITERISGKIRS